MAPSVSAAQLLSDFEQRIVRVNADLRAMAHNFLPGFALAYLEGGAEAEQTLARNLAALPIAALWAREERGPRTR